ncbi:MAG: hypothetical protein CM15mP45_16210 [Deltaproteobacteria bacterium]|nr:MAG: hypothetical protein CM15mP45_16210 [Deltaproteobacteria bacterium]
MENDIVKMENISKYYGNIRLLIINLYLRKGEVLGLVGRNAGGNDYKNLIRCFYTRKR